MGDGSNSINYHRVGVIRENPIDVSIRQMIKGISLSSLPLSLRTGRI